MQHENVWAMTCQPSSQGVTHHTDLYFFHMKQYIYIHNLQFSYAARCFSIIKINVSLKERAVILRGVSLHDSFHQSSRKLHQKDDEI